MIKNMVTMRTFVLFLALRNISQAFRLPSQDEITNAVGTAMLRQAGADLTRKFLKKFGGNLNENYAGPTADSGGNGIMNAVLQGVGNGLASSFGRSSGGIPGGGGLINTVVQGLSENRAVPTHSGQGGGLMNTLTQGLTQGFGGNSVGPTSGGPGGGLMNTLTQGLTQGFYRNSISPTSGGSGQGSGFLDQFLGNIGTSYGGSNRNSAGAGLVNTILRETASALKSHRTGKKEGFRLR